MCLQAAVAAAGVAARQPCCRARGFTRPEPAVTHQRACRQLCGSPGVQAGSADALCSPGKFHFPPLCAVPLANVTLGQSASGEAGKLRSFTREWGRHQGWAGAMHLVSAITGLKWGERAEGKREAR